MHFSTVETNMTRGAGIDGWILSPRGGKGGDAAVRSRTRFPMSNCTQHLRSANAALPLLLATRFFVHAFAFLSVESFRMPAHVKKTSGFCWRDRYCQPKHVRELLLLFIARSGECVAYNRLGWYLTSPLQRPHWCRHRDHDLFAFCCAAQVHTWQRWYVAVCG